MEKNKKGLIIGGIIAAAVIIAAVVFGAVYTKSEDDGASSSESDSQVMHEAGGTDEASVSLGGYTFENGEGGLSCTLSAHAAGAYRVTVQAVCGGSLTVTDDADTKYLEAGESANIELFSLITNEELAERLKTAEMNLVSVERIDDAASDLQTEEVLDDGGSVIITEAE